MDPWTEVKVGSRNIVLVGRTEPLVYVEMAYKLPVGADDEKLKIDALVMTIEIPLPKLRAPGSDEMKVTPVDLATAVGMVENDSSRGLEVFILLEKR